MPNDTFVMSARQAAELDYAFSRNGWSPAEVKQLSEGDILATVRDVLRGYSEIKPIEHVINLDADPFVPNGWKVEKHQKGGSFKWDPKQVQFYLSPNQQDGKSVKGDKLRDELAGKPVFNANLLDFLLANKHLIPEEWKKDEQGRTRYIFFWGTEYRDSDGNLYVRCLSWDGGTWRWNCNWLGIEFVVQNPAALRAS